MTDADLMAYVDGELDADATRAVEAAVAADPEARAKVEMFRQTSQILKAACAETFYSTGLDHLRVPRARPAHAVARRRAGLAAAFLVAGLAGFGGGRLASLPPSARDTLLDEVAEYHEVFSREDVHLFEVPAANIMELQDWLSRRVGRPLPVPDLSMLGMRFAGGRMLVIDGKPVGELMYFRGSGRPVAVCVTRLDGSAESLRVDTRRDLRLASWTDGRHAYVVVGEMDRQVAAEMANLVAAQLRS